MRSTLHSKLLSKHHNQRGLAGPIEVLVILVIVLMIGAISVRIYQARQKASKQPIAPEANNGMEPNGTVDNAVNAAIYGAVKSAALVKDQPLNLSSDTKAASGLGGSYEDSF